MAQLELMKEEIGNARAELTYIAAEKRNGMHKPGKYLEKNPISYPFLLDEDRTTTRAFGLYHGLGIDALNIAHPATLVVDQERIVKYIYRGQNQHDRAPVELVLAAIRNLKRN